LWPALGGDREGLRCGQNTSPLLAEDLLKDGSPIPFGRAYLDGAAQAGRRDLCGQLDGRVEVVGLEEVVAADRSLSSTKGPPVVSVLPSCTRTVVAFSGSPSGRPGVTPGVLIAPYSAPIVL
jgi:hypothetical protein